MGWHKSQAIPMLINKVVEVKKNKNLGFWKAKRNYLYVTDCAK